MFTDKIPRIAIFAITAILIVFAVSGTSKNAQATVLTSWSWTVDPSCLQGDMYKCNVPAGLSPSVGIPDLREAVPQQIGLQNTNHNSYLRVSTAIANTGTGQWQMKSVIPPTVTQPQQAEQQLLNPDGTIGFSAIVSDFEYHPAHKHFHIAAVSSYELYTADGSNDNDPSNNVATGIGAQKVTFCLIDWVKISGNSPNNQRAYSSCDGDFQGVSPGWMDQYHQSLEGQELNVTNLPTGYYFVVLTSNPEHHFIESNFNNNISWTLLHYINDNKGNPKLEILGHSDCTEFPGLCQFNANR